MDHVPGAVEDVAMRFGYRGGVSGWNDAVLRSPDRLNRNLDLIQTAGKHMGLPPAREGRVRDGAKRLPYPVEPLVLQQFLYHVAADKRRVGEQHLQDRLELLAPIGGDGTFDVV